MHRKLFVNALALVVVFVVGGAALAANGVPVPFLADTAAVEGTDALVLPPETDTPRPETDTARPDNFGQVRSAEVRAFGECMREADSAE
ncbi:MAG: hypothetical protein M3276_05395, partial [Actinomycetota bacterium]|nr:hypothetical protein [Actinomycetota bacterium]